MKGSSARLISGDMPIRKPSGMRHHDGEQIADARHAQARRRAGCRGPCRWGLGRRMASSGAATASRPTSSGPGIADLPWVAVSAHQLGVLGVDAAAAGAVPPTASCQARGTAPGCRPRPAPALKEREAPIAQAPLDREALRRIRPASSGSNALPMTENVFVVALGGVSPASAISFAASVARKTCLATAW